MPFMHGNTIVFYENLNISHIAGNADIVQGIMPGYSFLKIGCAAIKIFGSSEEYRQQLMEQLTPEMSRKL